MQTKIVREIIQREEKRHCVRHDAYEEKLGQVVKKNANDRPIVFSSFIPDAAQLMKKLQSTYPVRSLVHHSIYLHSSNSILY